MNQYVPLDPTIRARAKEAFAADAAGLNDGRHDGTFWDGLNWTGGRRRLINDIISKNPTMDSDGKFNISWNDRFFGGVNDDDIAKALALKDQRLRKTSELGQTAADLDVNYDTTTSQSDLRKKVAEAQNVKRLEGDLKGMDGGGEIIKRLEASGNLNSDALQIEKTRLQKLIKDTDPGTILARTLQRQQITSSQNADARAADSLALQGRQLSFEQTQAAENARNRWDDKREQREQNAMTRQMNAENNAMQMQLEYSRLAQQERQNSRDRKDKALMVLLQGFNNLTAGFTV